MESTPHTALKTEPRIGRGAVRPARCSPSPACTRSTRSSGSCATRASATATRSPSSSRASSSRRRWSQNATNIVAQKYFRGQLDSPARERSVKQMIGRVAGTIADWGRARGYFATAEDGDAFEAELTYILLHQMAAFNSPVWFNVGFEEQPQCSACFILSRRGHDGLDPRLEHQGGQDLPRRLGLGHQPLEHPRLDGAAEQGRHRLRARSPSCAAPTPGPARSSPAARRAARRRWSCSTSTTRTSASSSGARPRRRTRPPRCATPGFDMSIDGDGFTSIQYQNANNSVRVTDEFMHAVEDDDEWHLIARATGEPVGEPMQARELMREIAEAAWRCADPGVQYDTTINQWHTSPNSGRINASNPCSEYMHVDDSACNLASLNLMKFRRAGRHVRRRRASSTPSTSCFLAQEIVVGPSSYPTEEIGVNARAFRQLGLGYANLGAFLMANGMPYDSDAGRGTAAAITALMTGRAYAQSAQDRRGDRPVRALRGEPRGAQRRHADAPRRVVRDPGLDAAPTRALLDGRARRRGTRPSRSASSTATATRRRRCSRPRGRSRS